MSHEDSRLPDLPDVVLLQRGVLEPVARALAPMFAPAPWLVVLAASASILWRNWDSVSPFNLAQLLRTADSVSVLTGLALAALGIVVHELGHAGAAARAGRPATALGMTRVFGVVPAFYLQLAPEDEGMSRWDRLSIELSGSVLQLVYAAVLVLIAPSVSSSGVLIGGALSVALAAWQLLPLPAHDGYYALRALRR